MSKLSVEDIKNHFEKKLADPENRRAARDLYALNEIMKLERQARIKPIVDAVIGNQTFEVASTKEGD